MSKVEKEKIHYLCYIRNPCKTLKYLKAQFKGWEANQTQLCFQKYGMQSSKPDCFLYLSFFLIFYIKPLQQWLVSCIEIENFEKMVSHVLYGQPCAIFEIRARLWKYLKAWFNKGWKANQTQLCFQEYGMQSSKTDCILYQAIEAAACKLCWNREFWKKWAAMCYIRNPCKTLKISKSLI